MHFFNAPSYCLHDAMYIMFFVEISGRRFPEMIDGLHLPHIIEEEEDIIFPHIRHFEGMKILKAVFRNVSAFIHI